MAPRTAKLLSVAGLSLLWGKVKMIGFMEPESIRIILVDDHDMVREAWRMLLHSYDHLEVVGECASAAEAMEKVPRLSPDVVLMDINMSPVNGFEATSTLLEREPGTRIIGISLNNQPSYARNLLQLGARGYITKSSSREEMAEGIREVMKGHIYICAEVRQRMHND